MLDRGRRRRLAMGLSTVLGLRMSGFFIPHRHAAAAGPAAREGYRSLEPAFERARPAFAAFLDAIDALTPALAAIGDAPPPAPRFDQTWFPGLDAAALYTLVRTRAPARIVEVGSGHSTRFIMRALADAGRAADVVAIDPAPRADIDALPLTLLRRPLQAVDPAVFGGLGPGDLMLIDSSHVLMPGTDVDVVLNRVLPALPPGALAGFHDIFLPDPYPDAWPFDAYNEQSGVAALLQGGWRPVFASAFVASRMAERRASSVLARLPFPEGARESLLIVERQGD